MSGRRSRNKGAAYERELANRWSENGTFPEARRGIGQARSASEVSDVEGTKFWVEAKCKARPNPFRAMEQAEEATDGRPCVVVACRREKGKPKRASTLVCMRLETFEDLVRGARREKPKTPEARSSEGF